MYSYYPPMQSPLLQTQQQTPNIKPVNGKVSVENFYLPPNSSDIFLDEEHKKVYTKRVDASGAVVIKSLSYTEDEEEKPIEYVTKAEFEAFKSKMKGARNESNSNGNGK